VRVDLLLSEVMLEAATAPAGMVQARDDWDAKPFAQELGRAKDRRFEPGDDRMRLDRTEGDAQDKREHREVNASDRSEPQPSGDPSADKQAAPRDTKAAEASVAVSGRGDGGESGMNVTQDQSQQGSEPQPVPVTTQQGPSTQQTQPTATGQEPMLQTKVVEPVVPHLPEAKVATEGEARSLSAQQPASTFTGEIGRTPPRVGEAASDAAKPQSDADGRPATAESSGPRNVEPAPATKTPVPASSQTQSQSPTPSPPVDDSRQGTRPTQFLRDMVGVDSVRVVEGESEQARGQVAAQTDQTNSPSTPEAQGRPEAPQYGQMVEQVTITKSSEPGQTPASGAAAPSETDAALRPVEGGEAPDRGQSEVRLAGGEGRAETQSSDRVPQGRVVDYVVRVARANLGRENWQVQIRLSPPQLGTLRLDVSVRQGVLNMQVLAETAEAKHLIDSRLGQLRDALQQNGIMVERLEVDTRRPAPNESSQNNGDQTSRQGTGQSGQSHGQAAGGRGDGHERGRGFGAVWDQQYYGPKAVEDGPEEPSAVAVADASRVAVDVTV